VVFRLDKVVTSNKEIEQIYQELFKLYPQADCSVGQTSRMFFGSNSGYEVIDWDNRLDTVALLQTANTEVSEVVETISGLGSFNSANTTVLPSTASSSANSCIEISTNVFIIVLDILRMVIGLGFSLFGILLRYTFILSVLQH